MPGAPVGPSQMPNSEEVQDAMAMAGNLVCLPLAFPAASSVQRSIMCLRRWFVRRYVQTVPVFMKV